MNESSSFLLVGDGKLRSLSILTDVGLRWSLLILNPRYSTSSMAKWHLSRFTRRFASSSALNTSSRCFVCSSRFAENTTISSR